MVFVCFWRRYLGVLGCLILAEYALVIGTPMSETPRQEGILRLARTTDPKTLDPVLMTSMEDFLLWYLLHLPLLDLTNGTSLVPCAAQSWSASPDHRHFTVQLRPGVKFSSGRTVVAEDYVFALERMVHPKTEAWLASYLRGIRGTEAFISEQTNHVAGIKAVSSSVFSVELDRPDPTFPYLLYSCTAIPREEIIGREYVYAVRPVCTGPYQVQEWVRGNHLRFTHNPHYQGPTPQHFDEIDLHIGGDETTHLMMFERGELDIANITGVGISRPSHRRLTLNRRWSNWVERVQLFYTYGLILNTEVAPLTHLTVRRAINHAIDRDRRMQVALGFNTRAEGLLPPSMPGYSTELRGYDYNPSKARQLLSECGLSLPLRVALWHGTSDEMGQLAQGIQWDLKQVGIEIELKRVTTSEMFAAAQSRGKVPMTLLGWGADLPDPKGMLAVLFDGRVVTNVPSINEAFYSNPAGPRLLDEVALETDWSRRFKVYQHVEEMIVGDAPWVCLGHQNAFALRQPWLKVRCWILCGGIDWTVSG